MRPAALSPLPYRALPPINIAVLRPDRRIAAACSTLSTEGIGGWGECDVSEIAPPSFHATSAGTISVAICPFLARAATIASAASRPRREVSFDVRSHLEKGSAIASILEESGVSYC